MSPKVASYTSEATDSPKKSEIQDDTLRECENTSMFCRSQGLHAFPTAVYAGWTLNTPRLCYVLPVVQQNTLLYQSQVPHHGEIPKSSSATSDPFEGQTATRRRVIPVHMFSETGLRRNNYTGGYAAPEQSKAIFSTFSEAHRPQKLVGTNDCANAVDKPSTTMNNPPTRHQGSKIARTGSLGRPRSQAIAIKPSSSRHHDDYDEIHSESSLSEDQKAYDWATWRMYHRIIEHRQKHPLSVNCCHLSDSADSTNSGMAQLPFGWPTAVENPMSSCQIRPTPLRCSDYLLEGEVFELDDI